MESDLQFEIHHTEKISVQRKSMLVQLAMHTSGVAEEYVRSRFAVYDYVVLVQRENKIESFQFIQEFHHEGDLFIYFGPLFSMQHAFLPLIIRYLGIVVEKWRDNRVNLLAEIQNPKVFLFFKILFGDWLYPKIDEPTVPKEIQSIAERAVTRLKHVTLLNLDTLATTSVCTLYKVQKGYEPFMQWLEARGINLIEGGSQMVIVSISKYPEERKSISDQLTQGVNDLRNWRECKRSLLQQFQEVNDE